MRTRCCPPGGMGGQQDLPVQLAGAAPRATTAVWCWPVASSQPTVTLSPGLWPARALVRSLAELMVFESTDVMVSPATMPAARAGVPAGTAATTAPPVWVRSTETPRNAPLPMVPPLGALPDSIC